MKCSLHFWYNLNYLFRKAFRICKKENFPGGGRGRAGGGRSDGGCGKTREGQADAGACDDWKHSCWNAINRREKNREPDFKGCPSDARVSFSGRAASFTIKDSFSGRFDLFRNVTLGWSGQSENRCWSYSVRVRINFSRATAGRKTFDCRRLLQFNVIQKLFCRFGKMD